MIQVLRYVHMIIIFGVVYIIPFQMLLSLKVIDQLYLPLSILLQKRNQTGLKVFEKYSILVLNLTLASGNCPPQSLIQGDEVNFNLRRDRDLWIGTGNYAHAPHIAGHIYTPTR